MGELKTIIHQLKVGNNHVFEHLYSAHYRNATAYIRANGGNEEDARDIFQEALFVLYKQAQQDQFALSVEVGAYLYGVTRNLWLYHLRKKRNRPEVKLADVAIPEQPYNQVEAHYQAQMTERKHNVVATMLATLKEECRNLLYYAYYCKLPNQNIAQLLGYTEAFVKVKKHRCMEALRDKVKQAMMQQDEE